MKNVLLDKDIILPSSEISKNKVILVAGAITQPFGRNGMGNDRRCFKNLGKS